MDLKSVLIGLQASSGETHFPRKAFEPLGPASILDRVIDSCMNAAKYSNRYTYKRDFTTNVALLIPFNDAIKKAFTKVPCIEGDPEDILSNYVNAMNEFNADYVCRVTSDCPMIPPYIITKHITLAVTNEYDYISNIQENCRLAADGIDCEVMSRRMLDWLNEVSVKKEDRERVSILARQTPPAWAKLGFAAGFFDQSDVRLRIRISEDIIRIRKVYDKVAEKLIIAEKLFGRNRIHRF